MSKTITRSAMAVMALFILAACMPKREAPQMGNLTRTFTMVDGEGRPYGHILLDPLGGGKVMDSSGRVIGYVVGAEQ